MYKISSHAHTYISCVCISIKFCLATYQPGFYFLAPDSTAPGELSFLSGWVPLSCCRMSKIPTLVSFLRPLLPCASSCPWHPSCESADSWYGRINVTQDNGDVTVNISTPATVAHVCNTWEVEAGRSGAQNQTTTE